MSGLSRCAALTLLPFKFGDDEREIVGIVDMRIPIPGGQHIAFTVHVVQADIPPLIGIKSCPNMD